MYAMLPQAFLTAGMVPAKPIPFSDFRTEFLANYDESQRAPATRRGMSDVLKALQTLGVESTDQLTVELLNRYVASMPAKLSPNTVHGRLRYAQRICSIAFRSGYVAMNPFFIKPLREFVRKAPSRRAKQWHTPEEIGKVIARMEQRISERSGFAQFRERRTLAVCMTLAYTGARATEVYWLETTDVDLVNARLVIRPKDGHRLKTASSERVVLMPPRLVDAITAWLPYRLSRPQGFPVDMKSTWLFPTPDGKRPWTSGSPGQKPRDRLTAIGLEAGVPGFNPLSLRHSLCTAMQYAGASDSAIQQQLGHTNLVTQTAYKHRNEQALRAIINGIEF
jgi:integrase